MTWVAPADQWIAMGKAIAEDRIVALHEEGKSVDEIVLAVSPMAYRGLVHPHNPLAGEVRATVKLYDMIKENAKQAKKGKAK